MDDILPIAIPAKKITKHNCICGCVKCDTCEKCIYRHKKNANRFARRHRAKINNLEKLRKDALESKLIADEILRIHNEEKQRENDEKILIGALENSKNILKIKMRDIVYRERAKHEIDRPDITDRKIADRKSAFAILTIELDALKHAAITCSIDRAAFKYDTIANLIAESSKFGKICTIDSLMIVDDNKTKLKVDNYYREYFTCYCKDKLKRDQAIGLFIDINLMDYALLILKCATNSIILNIISPSENIFNDYYDYFDALTTVFYVFPRDICTEYICLSLKNLRESIEIYHASLRHKKMETMEKSEDKKRKDKYTLVFYTTISIIMRAIDIIRYCQVNDELGNLYSYFIYSEICENDKKFIFGKFLTRHGRCL